MTTEGRVRWSLAVAAGLVLAGAATARAGEESGLSLGARVAYGIPMGDASAGVSLGDVVSGQVPVQLDATWRLDRSWRLGLYAQYGFAPIAGAFCPAGASCSGQNLRLGVQAAYAFGSGNWSPWVGAGLGVEWLTAKVSTGGAADDLALFGLEVLNLQGGADWRPSPGFTLGPFVSFALGQYRTVTSGGVSQDLDAAMHGWLQLGVRGVFDL